MIGRIIQVIPIFIILRPRPRTYASTSPLLLLQLHQQQQLLSVINIINSTSHHLQHAKLDIRLEHLTSHAAYERSGGPPKRPAAKRPCNTYPYEGYIVSVHRTVMENRPVDPGSIQGSHRRTSFIRPLFMGAESCEKSESFVATFGRKLWSITLFLHARLWGCLLYTSDAADE